MDELNQKFSYFREEIEEVGSDQDEDPQGRREIYLDRSFLSLERVATDLQFSIAHCQRVVEHQIVHLQIGSVLDPFSIGLQEKAGCCSLVGEEVVGDVLNIIEEELEIWAIDGLTEG